MPDFDLVVVGGGWGGYTAALTLAQAGGRVALVEGDRVGGVCLHRGCIPTKALLETAQRYQIARESAAMGVRTQGVDVRWPDTLAHSDAVVATLEQGMEDALRLAGVERVAGWARLTAGRALTVAQPDGGPDRELTAPVVLIATGSAPKSLPFLPVDGTRIVTSDEALRIPPPGRAVIVGAGAVGLEFASLWSDLGSEVTVLEALPRVLPQEDADVAAAVADALTARGVQIATDARIDGDSVRTDEAGVRLAYETGGERQELKADVVLVAVGRAPRTSDLAPDVELRDGAVVVDHALRTTADGVYAVGDVTGGLQLAHVAAAQGRFVGQSLAGQTPPPVRAAQMPRAVYTRPGVGAVGLTEEQARESGRTVAVGRARLRRNARALIAGAPQGLVKIVADTDTGDVLGAHIVGVEAPELAGQLALASFLDASVWELATSVQPHPSVSEAVAEAAQAALRRGRRRKEHSDDE